VEEEILSENNNSFPCLCNIVASLMSYIGVLAAARIGAMKNIEKKLLKKGAVSRRTAVTPEEAEITSKRELGWLNHLIKKGKIGKTKDGKVWWKE